jgi:hypothetical protein
MDILTSAITTVGAPGTQQPVQVYVTINGTAQELQALGMAIEKALVGSPQVIETTTLTKVPVRILVDRLGSPAPQGA